MEWVSFHHPDICPVVLGRRASEELLQFLFGVGEILMTRGRSVLMGSSYPNMQAFHSSLWRLKKAGLIVSPSQRGETPRLTLTEAGRSRLPDAMKPERWWRGKWNGVWYMLVYDVPETQRGYRDRIREFLLRMRMGCLQRSVWVSPRDVRPEYDDLARAAAIEEFSFLVEARNVLGRSDQEMVLNAWPFADITRKQRHYCQVCKENLAIVKSGELRDDEFVTLAREAGAAYLAVMTGDPLLPKPLWPADYKGAEVYRFHKELMREIGRHF